jgi:arylsulfatase A-like enzyme
VLILVWDTVRAKSLSTYGYHRDTSRNLTELGKEGVVFQRAVATSPWTLPSHASLFTGRWVNELSARLDVPLDDAEPTLAEVLSRWGYVTAGFVANQHYCSRVHGLERGFLHYADFNVLGTEFVLSCQLGRRLTESTRVRRWTGRKDFFGRKSAERIDRDFLQWIDKRPRRPFFAFLNYYDAHTPYLPPPPFDERFGSSRWREEVPYCAHLRRALPVDPENFTRRQRKSEQDAYDGSIAYMDACLGRLLGELERRGILDDTIVIVTSDHGEHFDEHGLRDHGNSLYRPLLHVPLVIRYPKHVPAGLRPSEVVSLRDLPATVIDLLGRGEGSGFPGHSLRGSWEGTESEDSRAPPAYAALRPPSGQGSPWPTLDAVIAEGFHYIKFDDGHEELFDFWNDPQEADDLSSSESLQETLLRLRALVAQHLKGPTGNSAGSSGK